MEPIPSLLLRSRARQLIDRVAQAHGFEGWEIETNRSHEYPIVQARQSAMYVLSRGLHLPKAAIGRLLNRDHTTVIHDIRRVEANPRLLQLAEDIIATELPLSLPSGPLPTDPELHAYLAELDELLDRGNGIKRLLTGCEPLEVTG